MKTILLTGAGGGIGGAIARAFIGRNCRLALCCNHSREKTDALCKELTSAGTEAIVLRGDIRQKAECVRLVEETVGAFGTVDVLINNAGFLHQQPFLDIPEDEWDLTLNTNLKAPFLLSQAVFPHMIKNGGGRILNMASSGGQLGGPLAPHYAASKAGLICLTKSLARLGGPHNIVSCAIAPGLVLTEMSAKEMASEAGREKLKQIPLERAATPEEIATLTLFLALEAAYITGQTININGGLYMG